MDGILVINKESGYTSRDVVNIVGKTLGTKKVGHTGTLDPLAQGVLVLCVGAGLKMCEVMTEHDKEYIAEGVLGMETDTLDIEGKIINENDTNIKREKLEEVISSFKGSYLQEVPKYSAVKVNGKKLYEYARNNIPVVLPKKEVTIHDINLLDARYENGKCYFKFKVHVSRGTYIRSLIRDIAYKLGTFGTMTSLVRTRVNNFTLNDSFTLKDIKDNNFKIMSILEAFPNIKRITMDNELLFKVKNGRHIDKFTDCDMAFMLDSFGKLIALYKNDGDKARMYKFFMN